MRTHTVAQSDPKVVGHIGPTAADLEARFRRVEERIAYLEDTLNEYGRHIDELFATVDGMEEERKSRDAGDRWRGLVR